MNARKAIVAIGLPVALVFGTAVNARADDEAQDFKNITLQQIMGRGWNDFERTFAALSSDPRNDQAFQEMSVVIGEARALNKIGPYLEAIVKRRPADKAMRTVLGRVYKDLIRDPVRAREQFQEVLKQDPNDFFCHYQLAEMLARQGDKDFDEATKHFQEAAAKIPPQLADLRSKILKELGDHLYSRAAANQQYVEQACAAWDAMTGGMRRFDLPTYEELAGEYRSRSLWPKVQETYERYLKVLKDNNDSPDNVTRCRLKTSIAEACENQEHFAEAVAAYTEAVGLLDENTWQRRKLETRVRICREKLNQSAAYEAELKKAVEDNPSSVAARQSLSRVLVQEGRLDEAGTVLEAARQLSPRNVPVISALEGVYRKAGKDDLLATILRARIELSPEDFGAYIDLADLHVRGNRTADAEKVLSELEGSPNQLPEKFLVLARAYWRFGLARRAFVLYQKLADGGQATAEQRFEFCDFCLGHAEFAPEARVQADKLCQEGALGASGYVRLSDVFGSHGKKDDARRMLERGLAACAKRADGSENKEAVFTLNMALSDLEHRLGQGHHGAAIGSTLKAMLAAPDLHFKQLLNDRLITLLTNYGNRHKLLYTSEEEAGDPKMFGGMHGAGIAPWVDFLNSQANSREDADLWMLLGQINETVEVDADIPGKAGGTTTAPAPPKRIRTDLAQARLCYEKVIDMEFQNVEAHRALARVLADPAVDEYEKAINELEVLSLLNPVTKWESMQAIGDLYATAGETEKAREKWQAVAAQSASEPDLLGQVAMRMFRGGDVGAAVNFAQRTAAMSPFVFRNRAALANLLALVATVNPTAENLARSGDELAETLKLAQTSPGMSGFVPSLSRRLFDSRVDLARLQFGKGDFKAARNRYEAAAEVQKKTPWVGSEGALVDVQVQIARCVEAMGDAENAMRLYVEALKDRPGAVCWLSAGVTASGQSFLNLKREGRLVEGGSPAVNKAAAPVRGTPLATYDLHEAIRGAVVSAAGETYLEAAGAHYRANGAADGLTVVSDQDWPAMAGRSDVAASLTENGAGEKVLETHVGGVELRKKLVDVIGAASESLWYPLVVAGAAGSEKLLLTESLNGKVYVIDARMGVLQCTVSLDVAAMAPPVVADDVALVHSMRNGVVQVTAIDLKRLAIVYRSDLKAGERTVGGLADGPMIWKDQAIYVDPQTHRTLALSISDGSVTALDLPGNEPTAEDFRGRFLWRLGGDTLARVSNHGQVKMWRLAK